ncbi:efflux RND transporter permease subunit, partial [Magnetococcales bacterium HHB-1]
MSPVEFATRRPVAVASGVLLALLFGLLALFHLPIQLIPDVRKSMISVRTNWPGGSPVAVENEIVIPQEEVLKSIPGLDRFEASARYGQARLKLEFQSGTDMDSALIQVNSRLQQVRGYPFEAQKPTIRTADSDDSPITWMRFRHRVTGENEGAQSIDKLRDFVEDHIQTALERIPGVAMVNVYGGRERTLQVTLDPVKMAMHKLTITDISQALRRENHDISAGKLDEGKRSYLVRALGRFRSPDDLKSVVLRQDKKGAIYLKDVGYADFGYQDPTVNVRGNGIPSIAINAVRERNANVLEIMRHIRKTLLRLNETLLYPQGFELELLYDQTDYIYAAIDLVKQNLWIGGVLATAVLLFFLRSFQATIIIAIAIPISIIAAFLAMAATGRTLNVISLAGLAFAVGMVVDPAIVVLENIVRYREKGLSAIKAAFFGA